MWVNGNTEGRFHLLCSFLVTLKMQRNPSSVTITAPAEDLKVGWLIRLILTCTGSRLLVPKMSMQLRADTEIRMKCALILLVCMLRDHKRVLLKTFTFSAPWEGKEAGLRKIEKLQEHLRLPKKAHQSTTVEIHICVQNKAILVNINEKSLEGKVPRHLAEYN